MCRVDLVLELYLCCKLALEAALLPLDHAPRMKVKELNKFIS